MEGAMLRASLSNKSVSRVELDQRARDARLRLERIERLLVLRAAVTDTWLRREATKLPSDTHKWTKEEHEARPARETKGFQRLPARWVSGTLTGYATTP
jgi:hypothetical protein